MCRTTTALAPMAALLLLAAVALPVADSYRVLGFFPFNGRSHNIMFKALMEVLADNGHEVVQFSPFPQKTPRANYTDVDLSKEFPSLVNSLTFEQMTSFSRFKIVELINNFAGPDLCRRVFETQHFKDVMSGKYGKFDVVFTEIFGSDCWSVVAYKLNLPLISVVTAPDFAWMHERVGSVDNPSYIITPDEPVAGKMSFLERAMNTYTYLMKRYKHKTILNDGADAVVRQFFGADTPPINELVRRTSLVLVNRHVSVNPAVPVTPNVVHVGGLHLKDTKAERVSSPRLEAGLRKWMDEAEHGVIFFTLGSLVRTSSLPKHTIQALLDAFGALPQRVLWKYEEDDLDLPPNVRTASWLPQTDVLAHPKMVLFITHGGLMGTTEAVLLGVPMLGIPLFADQEPNVLGYQHLGIALHLPHTEMTKDNMLAAIHKLTDTDKYRKRAREVADLYLDRPRSAAAEALWWTEYVVRNKGAPHLRPLGADMPLYQYLLLDVAAVFLAAVLAVVLVPVLLVRKLLAKPRAAPAKQSPKKKTN
ncbi:UDP-glucuronosyltransferase 2B15-like [Thrips palmi]|uniref:UDP-glucuronosyltransferase n=1 Tax=Thrips palmi TaxID=161013 RepID=A0A6P9A7E4_THRPL|nr:UDP-glucuronosyltransferase 2B15-like [Thrips palmi]